MQDRSGILSLVLRFSAGFAGSVLLGFGKYRSEMLDPASPAFQCFTVGMLVAGALALVRGGRPAHAASLLGAFVLLQAGLAWVGGIRITIIMVAWSTFLCVGVFTAAVVFDRAAVMGYRFGKFLLAGSLLGCVYLATTPVATLAGAPGDRAVSSIWMNALLGIIIGDGVGLGVELVDFLPVVGGRQPVAVWTPGARE